MNRLRYLRKEKGLSLRSLAEQVNMSFSNLGSIERGEVQLREDTAKIFADFFNVSIDYLLGNSNDRNTPTSTPSPKEELKGVKLALYNQMDEITDEQAEDVLNFLNFIKNKK